MAKTSEEQEVKERAANEKWLNPVTNDDTCHAGSSRTLPVVVKLANRYTDLPPLW